MDTRRTPEEHGTPEFRALSPHEINHHMRRAMQMRAEVGAEIFDMAVRGIGRLARALAAPVLRLRPRHRAAGHGLRPDDHRGFDEHAARRPDFRGITGDRPAPRPGA